MVGCAEGAIGFLFLQTICKDNMNQKKTLHELLTMDISGANIKSYGFDI